MTQKGERSQCFAVFFLQIVLKILIEVGFLKRVTAFYISEIYDPSTIEAVKVLQVKLGLTDNDVDGNFGPATRLKLMEEGIGLNLGDISLASMTGTMVWVDADGQKQVWPPPFVDESSDPSAKA